MKKVIIFCLVVLTSVLLYILLSPLRVIDIRLSIAVQSIVYSLLTYLSLRKRKDYSAVLVVTAIFFRCVRH